MKGSAIPGIVITFAVAAMAGAFVTDTTISGVSNMVSDSSRGSDANWFQRIIGDEVMNKCDQSGVQDPAPLATNISKTLDGIENITLYQEDLVGGTGTKRRAVKANLGYGSSEESVRLGQERVMTTVTDEPCTSIKLNGTEADGSTISAANTINLYDSDSLKFRVFEPADDEVVVQVRQD